MAQKLNPIRCKKCKRLLAMLRAEKGTLEIKCHRCKTTNVLSLPLAGKNDNPAPEKA